VGRRGAHGAFRKARSCAEWRRVVDAGHYRYVVVASDFLPVEQPEAAWTRSAPAATQVLHRGFESIFRIDGRLGTARCV